MKTNHFKLFVVACIFLCSVIFSNTLAQKKRFENLCSDNSIAQDSTHEISKDHAESLIYNFQNNFRGLTGSTETDIPQPGWFEIGSESLAPFRTESIQAEIKEKDKILFMQTHCGLLLYLCKNDTSYYLAYNTQPKLNDLADPFLIPKGNSYMDYFSSTSCPGSFSKYDTITHIQSELLSIHDTCGYASKTLGRKKINIDAGRLMSKVQDISISAMENPVGFFHFRQINRLISQNNGKIRGIRIYWGYDSKERDKIRLVIFAVNPDGYNVLKAPYGQKLIILERSWPPDVN